MYIIVILCYTSVEQMPALRSGNKKLWQSKEFIYPQDYNPHGPKLFFFWTDDMKSSIF